MSDLVAIAYKDVPTAQQAASNVIEAQKAHLIELDDLVVVERREDGKSSSTSPRARASARSAARRGAA